MRNGRSLKRIVPKSNNEKLMIDNHFSAFASVRTLLHAIHYAHFFYFVFKMWDCKMFKYKRACVTNSAKASCTLLTTSKVWESIIDSVLLHYWYICSYREQLIKVIVIYVITLNHLSGENAMFKQWCVIANIAKQFKWVLLHTNPQGISITLLKFSSIHHNGEISCVVDAAKNHLK